MLNVAGTISRQRTENNKVISQFYCHNCYNLIAHCVSSKGDMSSFILAELLFCNNSCKLEYILRRFSNE